MRDLLTVLAVAVIVALLAALAGPHFIDWQAQRARVDAALGEALGLRIETRGKLSLRLLPAPALEAAGLTAWAPGGDGAAPAQPLLRAGRVWAELSPGALLGGTLRVVDASIDRPELRLTLQAAPAAGAPAPQQGPAFAPALDSVRVRDGRLTVADAGGRARVSVSAINASVSAASLAGPWRVAGEAGGAPFQLLASRREADGRMRLRVDVGAESAQTGRLAFDGDVLAARGVIAAADGRLSLRRAGDGPAGALSLSARLELAGARLTARDVVLEAGDPALPVRLEGEGGGDLDDPASLAFSLRAPRVELDRLPGGADILEGGGDHALSAVTEALARAAGAVGRWSSVLPPGASLRLAAGALALGDAETGPAAATLRARADGLAVSDGRVALPGEASLSFSADFSGAPRPFAGVTLRFAAPRPALAAQWLRRIGLAADLAAWISRQDRLTVEGRLGAAQGTMALHRLRLQTGDGEIAGLIAPDAGDLRAPARLTAQFSARGLDLGDLPPGLGAVWRWLGQAQGAAARRFDIRFTGEQLRLGARAAAGRAELELARDGDSLTLRRLEVKDLAGVDISAAGALAGPGAPLSGAVRAGSLAALARLAQAAWAAPGAGGAW
ncbi:AsmA family protein, partial [Camelimonas abortus]